MAKAELEKTLKIANQWDNREANVTSFTDILKRIYTTVKCHKFQNRELYIEELEVIEDLIDEVKNLLFEDQLVRVEIKKRGITLIHKILAETKKIFIVHGRNQMILNEVTSFLGRLKLDYIVLHKESNQGNTILEKFISQAEECSYAIVIMSADDESRLKGSNDSLVGRSRQNVVLELGFFLSHVGRKNIIILHELGSSLEIPSDFSGIVYQPFDEYGAWKNKVISEMRESGIYFEQKHADRV